jgi:hypothetical protein
MSIVKPVQWRAADIRAQNDPKVTNLDDYRWKEPEIVPSSRKDEITERLRELDIKSLEIMSESVSLYQELARLEKTP